MTNTFNRNDGTFAQVDIASLGTTNFPLNSLTKATTADIAMGSTAFFDGPSVSQGSAGVWYVSGSLTLEDTATNTQFFVKLWDGTTVIASGATATSGSSSPAQISLSGTIISPASNLKLSAANAFTATGIIKFNKSGSSADSFITAVRIG